MTEKAQQAFVEAQNLAQEYRNSTVGPLHLLQALLHQQDGIVPSVVRSAGIDVQSLVAKVTDEIEQLPNAYGPTEVGMDRALQDVLRQAEERPNH